MRSYLELSRNNKGPWWGWSQKASAFPFRTSLFLNQKQPWLVGIWQLMPGSALLFRDCSGSYAEDTSIVFSAFVMFRNLQFWSICDHIHFWAINKELKCLTSILQHQSCFIRTMINVLLSSPKSKIQMESLKKTFSHILLLVLCLGCFRQFLLTFFFTVHNQLLLKL